MQIFGILQGTDSGICKPKGCLLDSSMSLLMPTVDVKAVVSGAIGTNGLMLTAGPTLLSLAPTDMTDRQLQPSKGFFKDKGRRFKKLFSGSSSRSTSLMDQYKISMHDSSASVSPTQPHGTIPQHSSPNRDYILTA